MRTTTPTEMCKESYSVFKKTLNTKRVGAFFSFRYTVDESRLNTFRDNAPVRIV